MAKEEKDMDEWDEIRDRASLISFKLEKEENDLENVMMLRLAAQMLDDRRRSKQKKDSQGIN